MNFMVIKIKSQSLSKIKKTCSFITGTTVQVCGVHSQFQLYIVVLSATEVLVALLSAFSESSWT